jgi:hypothetical protein
LLSAVVTLAAASVGDADPPPAPAATPQRTFLISHWSFPKDPVRLKQFAAAGFNTVIATPEELAACRQYGWQALLAAPLDQARELAADKIVWGYFVFDEPARKKVPYADLAERVHQFHQLAPPRPVYINLNELDNPEEFIRVLRPRVLSYDYYQWWAGQEPFFPLLEKFRRAAQEAKIPLLCWVEAVAVPHGPAPADNEGRVRHSVYSALGYGAKGIQWWGWRPDNQDAARINAELKVLGPELVQLQSVDVFHTPPLPAQARPLPPDAWVRTATPSLLLGLFKNDQGEDFLLLANRDWREPNTASLTFTRPVSSVSILERKTGDWKQAELKRDQGQTLEHRLGPGDGELLRVDWQRK